MVDEVTGGLPEATLTPKEQKSAGLSVLGSKGVVLGSEQSADIKSKLLSMIAEREAQKQNPLTNFAESLTPYAGPVEYRAQNVHAQDARNQQREKDLIEMRMGIAQMDAQQAQLAQQKADKAAAMQGLNQRIGGGGVGPAQAPGGAGIQYPPQVANLLRNAYAEDPAKGRAMEAEFQKTMMNPELSTLQDYTTKDAQGRPQTIQRTKRDIMVENMFGPAATNVAPGGPAPANVVPGGPAPANVVPGGPAPSAVGAPVSKEAAAAQGKEIGAEAEKAGTLAAEKLSLMNNQAEKATTRLNDLTEARDLVKKHAGAFGKSYEADMGSFARNMIGQGFGVGQLGQVGVPGINEAYLQLTPEARKDPGFLDAWTKVNQVTIQAVGDYTAIANKGQGAVSNQERDMYKAAVGDPAKLSPARLDKMLTALQLNYQHNNELKRIYETGRDKGQFKSFTEFQRSPTYSQTLERQYYDTAKTLGIKNPARWDPSREVEAAPVNQTGAAPQETVTAQMLRTKMEERRKQQGAR